MALLMLSGALFAQTADSVDTGRALGDEPRVRRSHERNVLGAPVYYDTLGNIIGQPKPVDGLYRRPKHHFNNRLENDFSSIFMEWQFKVDYDFAFGCQVAWVPNRWGIYGSACVNWERCDFSVGPVWRLSDCGNWIDWQLFGGLACSRYALGAEVGIRMAAPRLRSDFCWTSVSMTIGRMQESNYVTLGLSLLLSPVVAISIW